MSAFGNLPPFLQESGSTASHDLLVLNARPDLTLNAREAASEEDDDPAFEEVRSTTAFLQRCFAGFQI
ncbi:MAG TPA: hypothetical protein VMI53_13795 [Opitutaceae bacterium]|nr:hypothetical protein [Opitutaceae bacterium]